MAAIEGETELERLVSRSRLIGSHPSLVLHGGGNTSTKLVETDHLGRERRVIRIKGSGSDLATITAADFPGLWLDDLLPLRERDAITDEEMVAYLSHCLVEPDAARPSIETLLHAFLPAAHVDHVHADAICSLANAPDPTAAVREALGPDVAVVEYVRPGFELSCRVADLADARAVVLAHHGLVTWGETHEASYGLTLELVDRAQSYLAERVDAEPSEPAGAEVESFLLRLRGRLSRERRVVLAPDRSQRVLADRPDVERLASMRSTPDHMLRIGGYSAVIPLDGEIDAAVVAFRAERGVDPRLVLVPGLGAIAAGPDARAARARIEIASHTHRSVAATLDRFGDANWLSEAEVHDFEYWPLELYKLTLASPLPELAAHVVLVTGAASGIGRDIAHDLAARGAHLVLADIDAPGLTETADGLARAVTVAGDLTDAAVADRAIHEAVASFGGLDAIVLNAGIAATGPLETLPDEEWERSLDVNLTSHFLLTRRALAALREQGIGGSLVYVASKNAFAPGAGFGPYSVAKAGLVQLMRIAALEGGPLGIRSNAVNPDAIFAGSRLWSEDLRRERAEAHGVALDEIEAFYASRSLLGRAVTGADVAEAVAFLVSDRSRSTTGAVLPVDGGVPAAFLGRSLLQHFAAMAPNSKTANIGRLSEIAQVAVKHGFGSLLEGRRSPAGSVDAIRGRHLREMLDELGPTFVKFGQLLSTRPDIVPPDIIAELRGLQDDVRAFPFADVERVIAEDLKQPIGRLFLEFNETPLAAASIGQVHRAVLPNGKHVVVKVQRPNAPRQIEGDIQLLEQAARLVKERVRALDFIDTREIVDEFARTIRLELDYRQEGRNAQAFHRNFAGHPHVVVPRVYWSYSSQRVLTLEYLEGVQLADLETEAWTLDQRRRLAYLIADTWLTMIFRHGFFHGDPHPANILVLDPEKIGLVDFGLAGKLTDSDLSKLTALFIDASNENVENLPRRLADLGVRYPKDREDEFVSELYTIYSRYYGSTLKEIDPLQVIREAFGLIYSMNLRLPSRFVMLDKAIATIGSVGVELYPDFNVFEVARPYARALVLERFSPSRIAGRARRETTQFAQATSALPYELYQTLEQVRAGEISLGFVHKGLDDLMHKLDVISNRLVIALIVVGGLIGSSLIGIFAKTGPHVLGLNVVSAFGFIASGVLGIWLLVGVIRSGRL